MPQPESAAAPPQRRGGDLSGTARIVIQSFVDDEDPMLAAWLRFRDAVLAAVHVETPAGGRRPDRAAAAFGRVGAAEPGSGMPAPAEPGGGRLGPAELAGGTVAGGTLGSAEVAGGTLGPVGSGGGALGGALGFGIEAVTLGVPIAAPGDAGLAAAAFGTADQAAAHAAPSRVAVPSEDARRRPALRGPAVHDTAAHDVDVHDAEPLVTVWRLLASNNRELARSAACASTPGSAKAQVQALRPRTGELAGVPVVGPRGDRNGWYLVLDGMPVLTCSRWYGAAASSLEAARVARLALAEAIVDERVQLLRDSRRRAAGASRR